LKRRQAKEKASAQALLAARNTFQTTTAAAATSTATAGEPTPANASVKRWSPNRLHVYHARKSVKRRTQGTGALAEIRHYQRAGGLLIQKLPFQRVCREIMDEIVYTNTYKIPNECNNGIARGGRGPFGRTLQRCEFVGYSLQTNHHTN
jgi:hypothetical protein